MKNKADSGEAVFTWKMVLLSFAFLIGMSPLLLYQFYRNSQRKAIRQHQAFTTATITHLTYHSSRGRHWYETYATYQLDGTTFTCTGKALGTLVPEQRRWLIGVRLPLLYEKGNPSNAELLSNERQFDRYNLAFPDSLAWTKTYF